MRRFITIEKEDVYTIEYDRLNRTYSVFIQCNRFRQQISKIYIKKGWAYRALNKELNKTKN